MRVSRLVFAISFFALSASAQRPSGPHPLTVRVIDSATREPVAGAEVSIVRDTLRVRRLGYRPAVIPTAEIASDLQLVTVGLVAIPRELTEVTVEASMNQILEDIGFFERRKRLAAGFFVDPNQMARMRPGRTSDIFERAPGAHLSNASSGGRTLRFSRAENCAPTVYVDGVLTLSEPPRLERVGRARTSMTRANESVTEVFGQTDHGIDEIGIRQIAAVEAYSTTTQAPPPFNGSGSSCGVVLFWTWDNLNRKPRG